MSKLIYFAIVLSFSFLHCDNPDTDTPIDNCPNAESYQMKDFSGLAACGWVLLQGDQSYEVINLSDFYDSFGEDINVVVELKTREDLASACQVGIISEIVCKR